VSLRDITERRRREQRLDVLTRVLRHNLRNDMTSVIGFGQFIEQTTDDEGVESAAQRLLDTCWELSALSDQAREIAETLDGSDSELSRHDLPTVVSRTVTDVRDRYPGVDVETSLLDQGSVVAVDALPKAVTQACENACKHNESDQPRVDIGLDRCTQDGREWVRLVIGDNGPGIPEQDITALEKGYETSLNHSSGLGLWLVKWVVETSGGRVEFPDVDDGGRVVIYLPAAPGNPETAKPNATARE
jgi:signal transduction histidine kinase